MKICRDGVIKFMNVLFTIAAILYGAGTLMAFINAFCRKVLNVGIYWGEELATYLIVSAFFLTLSYLELHDGSLCIGLLTNIVKNKKVLKALYIIRGIIIILLCFLIVRYGFSTISAAISTKLVTFTLRWPKAVFYSIAVSGFILCIISWLTILILNKGEKVE